jgi:hypothetical protein
VDDYEESGNTELALECANRFAAYFYGLDDNFEQTLLENRLLKKLNLLDEDGNLVNREGHAVDLEGNLIDKEGARVDQEGNRIDINNNPLIDDDVIDELEFEDDLVEKPKKKSTGTRGKKPKEPVA